MWTNDYIRIPFKERGRGREGADCWGLAMIVYQERLGIILPSLIDYENCKDKLKISDIIKKETISWNFIEKGQERPYDIAVFKMLGQPMHIGIVVERGFMIHSEKGSNVYISYYNKEQQWDRRLEGFFRYAANTSITSTISSS